MESTLKPLIRERALRKAALTRFKSYLETCDRTTPIASFKVRLSKITPIFEAFDAVQEKIEELVLDTELEAAHVTVRTEFEQMYCDTIGAAQTLLAQLEGTNTTPPALTTPTITSTCSDLHSRIRLPTIELPTFDGNYNQWISFKDTFESLIHNNDALSNIERFHYLKSSLKGNAATVIETLGISEHNYTAAWTTLKKRFEDTRLLKQSHLRSLCETPTLTKESCSGLRRLLDNTNSNLLALQALGENVDNWDLIMIYLLSAKLDPVTKREWEKAQSVITGNITLSHFTNFLERQCSYLERSTIEKPPSQPSKPQIVNKSVRPRIGQTVTYTAAPQTLCPLCSNSHNLYNCAEFKGLSVNTRATYVQQIGACFNCLNVGHTNKNCTRSSCKFCGSKHNTLLHVDHSKGTKIQGHFATINSPSTTANETKQEDPVQSYFLQSPIEAVILSTAVVIIKDQHGQNHECRALLDSGSQSNFITSAMVKKLGLPCTESDIRVVGIGGSIRNTQFSTRLQISSKYNGFRRTISCLVLPNITGNIPRTSFSLDKHSIPRRLKLADPHFNKSDKIDIIIGAGLFWDLQCIGRHSLGPNSPILQKTQLGWIVAGKLNIPLNNTQQYSQSFYNSLLVTNEQFHKQIEQFWDTENNISTKSIDSTKEHVLQNTVRYSNGRFIERIPFKETIHNLGNSEEQVRKGFLTLEQKLDKHPELIQPLGCTTWNHVATNQNPDNMNSRRASQDGRQIEECSNPKTGSQINGDSLSAPLEPDLQDVPTNRLSRFQVIQRSVQHLWKRWQLKYLHQLQQRNKWRSATPNKFGPGTMVVIKDDNLPPLKWRLGRILEFHPGEDNVARVATIKTAEGTIKRPITKICILPADEDASSIQTQN